MRIHRKVLAFLFALILIITNVGITSAQWVNGNIIATEYCLADTSQSYAYYAPSYYSAKIKMPAIFVFEPAARGSLGVSIFQKVAEEYGYLVFCSNNSKNGPVDKMVEAVNAMYTDVHNKFSVNSNRQYVSGFSGGSRFALLETPILTMQK